MKTRSYKIPKNVGLIVKQFPKIEWEFWKLNYKIQEMILGKKRAVEELKTQLEVRV